MSVMSGSSGSVTSMKPAAAGQGHVGGGLPLVVMLDLDGTMVGRVGSLLCEYDLHTSARAPGGGKTRGRKRAVPKSVRDSIVARLGWGVIRPHLVRFCKGVGPGVELFVYTASDATWASFIVPCVEASLGVRFNRPIFTRKDCVTSHAALGFRKSIEALKPALVRSLRSRYPALRTPADLRDRVLLVDNTPQVMADPRESARIVACPTYDYQCNYDVLSHIDVGTLHNEYRSIAPTLERHGLFGIGIGVDSYQRFAAAYYRRLARALESSLPANMSTLAGDRFFLNLEFALASLIRRASRSSQLPSGGLPACLSDAGVRELNSATASSSAATSHPQPPVVVPPRPTVRYQNIVPA